MSDTQTLRTVVVVGATGNQGGGVVQALLSSKSWHVKALTRDTTSSKSQTFLTDNQTDDSRLSLVQGHVYDKASLLSAFSGAYGVFAVTSETYSGKVLVKEEEMLHELEAGRNQIDAADECGVKHFVFSSLPDMIKATGGRFTKIYHMNNKYNVEQMAREKLKGATFLIPGFFYPNLRWPQYTQKQENGVVRFRAPLPGPQVSQWTDPSYDMGRFAARVFELGPAKVHGKTYLVLSPRISGDEMVKIFTHVTGQPAVYQPGTAEEFGEMTAPFVGPAFVEDATQMMQWAAIAPADKICYGSMDEDADDSFEDLGLRASTFEEWLQRSGWKGPE